MNKTAVNKGLRRYLPNYITFLSLGFGLISIVCSVQEFVYLAGILILVAAVLDSLDGFFARKLGLASNFGLQLDSLTDMVCFGVAPIVLVSQHLNIQNSFSFWFLPIFLIQIWAGAFRLARFNLQPPKENSIGESLGLTISEGGVILSLMVLSDLSGTDQPYPLVIVIMLFLGVSFFMVSRIHFPPFVWFIPHQGIVILYLITAVVLVYLTSIFTMFWILWLLILAASVCRHLFLRLRQEKASR